MQLHRPLLGPVPADMEDMDDLEEPPCDLLDMLGDLDSDLDSDLEQLYLKWGSSDDEQQQLHQSSTTTSSDWLEELQEFHQPQQPPAAMQPGTAPSCTGSRPGGADAGDSLYAPHPPPHPGAAAAGTAGNGWEPGLYQVPPMQSYGTSHAQASPFTPQPQQPVMLSPQQTLHQQQQQPWVTVSQQPLHSSSMTDSDQQQLQSGANLPEWRCGAPQADMPWLHGLVPVTGHGWVPEQGLQAPGAAAAGLVSTAAATAAAAAGGLVVPSAAAGGAGGNLLWSTGGHQMAMEGLATAPSDASTNSVVAGCWQGTGWDLGGTGELLVTGSSLSPSLAAAAAGRGTGVVSAQAAAAAAAAAGGGGGGGCGPQHDDEPGVQSAPLQEEFHSLRSQLCAVATDAPPSMDMHTKAACFLVGLSTAAHTAGVFHSNPDCDTSDPALGRKPEHFEQLAAAGLLDGSSLGHWAYKDGCHPSLSPGSVTTTPDAPASAGAVAPAIPYLSRTGSSSSSSGRGEGVPGMGSSYAIVVSNTWHENPRGTTSAEEDTRRRDFNRQANTLKDVRLAVRITGPGIPTAADGLPAWFQVYGMWSREEDKTFKMYGSSWRNLVMAPAVQVDQVTGLPVPLPEATNSTVAGSSSSSSSSSSRERAGKPIRYLPEVLDWVVFDPSPFKPRVPPRKGAPELWFKHTRLMVMRDTPQVQGHQDLTAAAAGASAGATGKRRRQPLQAVAADAGRAGTSAGQAVPVVAPAAATTSGQGASGSNRAVQHTMSPLVGYNTGINTNMATMYSSSKQQTLTELLQDASEEDSADAAAAVGGAASEQPQEESNEGSAQCARKRARKTTTNMYYNQQSA